MRRILVKIGELLGSKVVAAFLIGALALASALGMLIPQGQSFFQAQSFPWHLDFVRRAVSFLQLHRVFSSSWFLFLVVLFFLNLLACTTSQGYAAIKKWREGRRVSRWQVGTILFHTSLLIVCVGAFATLTLSMNGYMVLGVGQSKEDQPGNYGYLEKGILFREHGRFALKLTDQEQHFRGEKRDYTSSLVEITTPKIVKTAEVSDGQPVYLGNLAVYHHDAGFAPLLQVRKNGEILFRSYVIFRTEEKEETVRFYLSPSRPPGLPFSWSGEFYPDAVITKENKVLFRSERIRRPIVVLKLGDGSTIILEKGEKKKVGGYEFSFSDLTYWTGFDIVYDPGRRIAVAGAAGGVVSLLVMYGPGLPKRRKSNN